MYNVLAGNAHVCRYVYMYIKSGVKGQTRKIGSSVKMSSFQSFLCSHRGVLKPRSRAGLEAFSGKTQWGRERLVSPVSRILLYHQCPSDIISKVFSQSCKLSIRLQLIFQKFQFHILFNCTSLLPIICLCFWLQKVAWQEIPNWTSH